MQIKELNYGASCMKFLCNQVSTLFKMLACKFPPIT